MNLRRRGGLRKVLVGMVVFCLIIGSGWVVLSSLQNWEKSGLSEGTLVVGGDVMLGRGVELEQRYKNDWSWAWRGIETRLREADLAMVNLEAPLMKDCPLTDFSQKLCASPEAIEGLVASGVDIVCLANNHIMDYGEKGLEETREILSEAGIVGLKDDLMIKEVGDIKVGFLAFDDISQSLNFEETAQRIRNSKTQVDTLVTSWHWGTEYTENPKQRQKDLAYLAIENGADAVFGHHPHWIQEKETYREKPIYYSLGNLIFDQKWSEETQEGLMVKLRFKKMENGRGERQIILQIEDEWKIML